MLSEFCLAGKLNVEGAFSTGCLSNSRQALFSQYHADEIT